MVAPASAPDRAGAAVQQPHRLAPMVRRGVFVLASAGALAALVLAVPSLADVRHRLASVETGWLALGVPLEIGSCPGLALVFYAFFDRVPAALARRIAWVEMASGALLPGGGVTSYALGGLLLSRAGMDRRSIIVCSGGVYWLTSAVNALAILAGASLLVLGIGHGPTDFARAWLPLLITAPLAALIAASPRLVARRPSLRSHGWVVALVDGVDDAWRAARRSSWRPPGPHRDADPGPSRDRRPRGRDRRRPGALRSATSHDGRSRAGLPGDRVLDPLTRRLWRVRRTRYPLPTRTESARCTSQRPGPAASSPTRSPPTRNRPFCVTTASD